LNSPLFAVYSHAFTAATNITPLNTGIYSLSEAAKLTGVSTGRIRRWLKGYDFRKGQKVRHSDAVWQGQHTSAWVENRIAFLRQGVSWKTMRLAHTLAREEMGTEYPFCTNRFVTDGRKTLLKQGTASGDQALIDIATNQPEFLRLVRPFLKELEFADDHYLSRWWPLGKDRAVVVDPVRNFGQPTVAKSGVPTQVLARSPCSEQIHRDRRALVRSAARRSARCRGVRAEARGLRFFFDNNLAPKLAKSLHVLVEPDHSVVHLTDRFAANTPDETWMRALAGDSDHRDAL
jgi:hypothetical protein